VIRRTSRDLVRGSRILLLDIILFLLLFVIVLVFID